MPRFRGPIAAVLAACSSALAGDVAFTNELFSGPIPQQPADKIAAPDPDSFWKGWTGGIELGLNGSEGNTRTLNFRGGANAERKTSAMITTANASYSRATQGSVTIKNRAELGARNSWIFEKDSPWSYFIEGKYEYDDFQDWRSRISAGNGIGYAFIKNDKTTLDGRAGLGVTRAIGGSDNRWVPNGIFAADFGHKLTERQKITASLEYLPSLLNFPTEYRITARVGYEIVVDPEVKMSLKAGIEDRYNSVPGGTAERNDVDYFVVLAWAF